MLAFGLGRGMSLTTLTVLLLFSPLLMETVFAQSQPSHGWYKNSGSSPICTDCIGLTLQLFWENSYIYQHPGTDNLYWYAELRYLNTGNQTVTLNCGGRADPSLAKEHIRDTEGIPPNGDGYVPAEETFCSRNPNYTFSIEPGGSRYTWAIFHNVPPGGQVRLEWGAYGSSAWVNPWQSSFIAPQPAECPQELVNLGTCVPVSRTPEGKRPNLIVLVHGCCTDENGVREWDRLGGDIAEKIIQNKTTDQWEIVAWDWSAYTTPSNLLCPPCSFIEDAKHAYNVASGQNGQPDESKILKDTIVNAINKSSVNAYAYVHFMGHSAGAKLIHEASQKLAADKTLKKMPFIHLTFLDAYTQDDKDSGKEAENGIHKGYGYLESYPNHYAEHYVDRSPVAAGTNACLASAFNFDITKWKHTPDLSDPFGHQWPRHWYQMSVTSTSQKFKYGFRLSLESGNDLNNLITRRDTEFGPWKQCDLDTGLINENPNPDCHPAACW